MVGRAIKGDTVHGVPSTADRRRLGGEFARAETYFEQWRRLRRSEAVPWSDPRTPLGADELHVDALARAYEEAVCHGADVTRSSADDECLAGTLGLLGRITVHVPHLTLLMAGLADTEDAGAGACLAREARRQSAGVLRLGQRALEVHARDVGYAPCAWRDDAIVQASAAAITAVLTDRMGVPAHLASAQGAWLTCYVRATRLAR